MTINIAIPNIGVDELEVTEILVKIGDFVEIGQSIMVVEGDKASMEIPSPQAGIVKEIRTAIGDKVKSESFVMILDADRIKDNESSVGSEIKDNISMTHETFTDNQCLLTSMDSIKQSTEKCENTNNIHATPIIRRLAYEFGIDLTCIKGTGRKGRILREDIQQYVKQVLTTKPVNTHSQIENNSFLKNLLPWPNIDFHQFGDIDLIELSKIKKISGDKLQRNCIIIPQVTQFDEVDITEIEKFRKQKNLHEEKKKSNIKITLLPFIMKAIAKSLENFPYFNSSLSQDGNKLILKKYINIGIAIDTVHGLMVPVLRDVNKKGVIELSIELTELIHNARNGKLKALDMQGGCFTISNVGSIGGGLFTPIINAPEVAILGVSKSIIKPIWCDHEFVPKLMLPLSLSYDHRVIDGADGARFISFINHIMIDMRNLIM